MTLVVTKTVKFCDNITLLSLYAIAFFLPISKGIIESFSIIAIIFFIRKKIVSRKHIFKNPLNLWIYAYLVVCAFSIFTSSNIAISAKTFFTKTLQSAFLFFVIVETLGNEGRLKRISYVLCVSSALLGIDGIYQSFTHKDFLRDRPSVFRDRICASFYTPNSFGSYLATVIPFALSCFISKPRFKLIKLAYLSLFLVLVICLILTAARGALFSFFASLLFVSIWIRLLGIIFLLLGIFMIIIIMSNNQYLKDRITNLFTFMDAGSVDRKTIWRAAFKMFISKPWIGLGLGTFMSNFKNFVIKDYPHGAAYAHNCYLQMAAEIGVIGLTSFLLILALFFYSGIKALNTKEKSFSWHVLLASQAAILGYCVQMGVDTTLYALDLGMLFWLVLGIGVAAMKNLQSACDTRK